MYGFGQIDVSLFVCRESMVVVATIKGEKKIRENFVCFKYIY